jgi:hypothetical protein
MADGQDSYEHLQTQPEGTGGNGTVDPTAFHSVGASDIDHFIAEYNQQQPDTGGSNGDSQRSRRSHSRSEESELDPVEKTYLADLRIAHSNFQVLYFIVTQNGITAWGCYQQALREYFARRSEIFKIDKRTPFGLRQWEEIVREMLLLTKLCAWYRAQLPKELTDEIKEQLETDLAYRRLHRQMVCEILSEKKLSIATFQAIGACPPEMRRELYQTARTFLQHNPMDFLTDEYLMPHSVRHPTSLSELSANIIEA